jgi:hypothetical protein
MAIETLRAYVGVYDRARRGRGRLPLRSSSVARNGKDRQTPATPTRVAGVLGGSIGLATGLVVALVPFAAMRGGLLAGAAAGGAILGAVAGEAAAGMSRHDLKEAGASLQRRSGWARRRRGLDMGRERSSGR